MVTYSIALYQTSQSEQNHGSEPLVRLEEYIQGAFGISGESVNTYIQSETVPTPTEDPISGFTSMKPCDVSNQYYQNLTEWFKEWLSCTSNYIASDANLLVTDYCCAEGVAISDKYATTGAASNIGDVPDNYSETLPISRGSDAMRTALHELGHCLMDWTISEQGHHNSGQKYNNNDGNSSTPMGVIDSENYCDHQVPDLYTDNHSMFWSSCCVSNWE